MKLDILMQSASERYEVPVACWERDAAPAVGQHLLVGGAMYDVRVVIWTDDDRRVIVGVTRNRHGTAFLG